MKKNQPQWRFLFVHLLFLLLFLLVLTRLFYWQVLASNQLTQFAKDQYHSLKEVAALRGSIFSADRFPLATNQKKYLLFSILAAIEKDTEEISHQLAPLLIDVEEIEASLPTQMKQQLLKEKTKTKEEELKEKLNLKDLSWVALEHKVSAEVKDKITQLNLAGFGFEDEPDRFYPEASMAAHLLGFVGKNEIGQNTGYFGLEGFYDLELKGRRGVLIQETDAFNRPILIGSFSNEERKDGQDLVLFLDRTVQFIVEEELKKAIERYKAKSGSVIVMDPQTGGIISLAHFPAFDPREYFDFDKELFRNTLISDTYEPGSTFKIFVMAAALDQEAVKKETKCDICDQSLKIDKYEIKNWNEKYHPDSTMDQVIQNSDNIGMVFTARKLGLNQLWQYLWDFGFGQKTHIDLQGEGSSFLKAKKQWNEVDLATAAFGQGLAVTGMQMIQATGVIANGGQLISPRVVEKIITDGEEISFQTNKVKQVIKPKTAKLMTEIMVQAVEKGETSYLFKKLPGYKIAGKTGTAQIPVAGHYDTEKTITSFVGFAPANKPRFVMLTMLREPQASPWGSETAAPLFFNIAKKLFTYYGIQPE